MEKETLQSLLFAIKRFQIGTNAEKECLFEKIIKLKKKISGDTDEYPVERPKKRIRKRPMSDTKLSYGTSMVLATIQYQIRAILDHPDTYNTRIQMIIELFAILPPFQSIRFQQPRGRIPHGKVWDSTTGLWTYAS